jgi:hypothetical protein
MTNVDILFRYAGEPAEAAVQALSGMREVYGIRRMSFDRAEKTLCVEYDATRLNGPVVAGLVRRAGLEIVEQLPLIPPPAPEPVAPSAEAAKA